MVHRGIANVIVCPPLSFYVNTSSQLASNSGSEDKLRSYLVISVERILLRIRSLRFTSCSEPTRINLPVGGREERGEQDD